jgi:hypothetical protein
MPSRLRHVVVLAAAAALALLLACGLLGAGVRAGALTPPNVDVALGSGRLIARTSVIPPCSQLIGPDCIGTRARVRRLYTVWLFIRTERGTWENPEVRQLLSLPLGVRPMTP